MEIGKRIIEDIKRFKWLIIILILYLCICELLFHKVCPVAIVSGFPCPGCGTSRAILCIIQGDFYGSLQYNPLVPLWILLGAWMFYWRYIINQPIKWFASGVLIIGILTISLYVYRMIFDFPGSGPMVYFQDNILRFIFERIR